MNSEDVQNSKWITGYEGLYKITTNGEVISFKRKKAIKMKQTIKFGYCTVSLRKDGKEKKCLVHRLVAETYLDNPNNLQIVNHINEIKHDNRIENLEWTSKSENSLHGTGAKRCSEKRSKSVSQYTTDGLLLNTFSSIKEAAEVTGCGADVIGNCCRNVQKTAGGYVWKFEKRDAMIITKGELKDILEKLDDDFTLNLNITINDLLRLTRE